LEGYAVGECEYAENFPVISSFEVEVTHSGLGGSTFFVLSDFCRLLDAVEAFGLLGVDGVWLTAYTIKMTNIKTSQVNKDVFFGAFAPHFGQVFALVLTSSPHSLHFTNAIYFSLVCSTHND
jgi:hypothetical protein